VTTDLLRRDEAEHRREADDRLARIFNCLRAAERGELLREYERDLLVGYSGTKLIAVLQRLASEFLADADACYLEVGVFQGLTLLSVAGAVPGMACYGVDNFAFFDPERRNLGIVESRRSALGISNAAVLNADYEDALLSLASTLGPRKVAVYFVDGPHDYRSQLMCLEMALPHLHPDAIVVVDDCNYAHVRQANSDFLMTHPEFKLIFEAYTPCHPGNMAADEQARARDGWWNGVNVLMRDTADRLEPMLPPTVRDRRRFEAEHIAHAAEIPDLGADTGRLLSAIHHVRPLRFIREVWRLKQLTRQRSAAYSGRYPGMNTDSGDLAPVRFGRVRA
jgi:hypothetical protein